MKMVYNVVVHDEQTNEVEIIARSYRDGPVLNYVSKNRNQYSPAKLFATRIPAHALPHPFRNCIELQ